MIGQPSGSRWEKRSNEALDIPGPETVGVWTAEAWTAEDNMSSNVDAPNLDYKKD